jgi:hypothetical protein
MAFWVYGRDASSGQPRDPLYIETEHEDDARNQAAEAGLEVEEVEFVKSPEPEEVATSVREDNDVRCVRCGSHRVVPQATIWDQGQHSRGLLQAYVYADPNALLFKEAAYATLWARICADCGAADLYVNVSTGEAEGLYKAYRKSKSGAERAEQAAPGDRPDD